MRKRPERFGSMKKYFSLDQVGDKKDAGISEQGLQMTDEQVKTHKLFGRLAYTVRLWPFDDEDNFGKDRDGEEFYEFQETQYRLSNKVGESDMLMNIQELFIEVAIDDPDMFEGYTHFNNIVGFCKQERDEDIDKFMEYVKLIEPKENSSHRGTYVFHILNG